MLAMALAIVLCVGCDTEQGHLYDEGVSMELAQKRKATIKGLVYDLHFAIPDSIGQAVDGRVAISFALDEADEVVVGIGIVGIGEVHVVRADNLHAVFAG